MAQFNGCEHNIEAGEVLRLPAGAIHAAHRVAHNASPRRPVLLADRCDRLGSPAADPIPDDWRATAPVARDSVRSRLFEEVAAARAQVRAQVERFGPDLVQSGLLALLELRQPDTYAHACRVARSATILARAMGVDAEETALIRKAALLHDIGKVVVPPRLLYRSGRLRDDEVAIMRLHVSIGAEIVSEIPSLRDVAGIIAATHERFDGSGYPRQVAAADIPRGARIITLADSFDAMVTRRVYSEPMTRADALRELLRCAGSHFDPAAVRAWMSMMSASEGLAGMPTVRERPSIAGGVEVATPSSFSAGVRVPIRAR